MSDKQKLLMTSVITAILILVMPRGTELFLCAVTLAFSCYVIYKKRREEEYIVDINYTMPIILILTLALLVEVVASGRFSADEITKFRICYGFLIVNLLLMFLMFTYYTPLSAEAAEEKEKEIKLLEEKLAKWESYSTREDIENTFQAEKARLESQNFSVPREVMEEEFNKYKAAVQAEAEENARRLEKEFQNKIHEIEKGAHALAEEKELVIERITAEYNQKLKAQKEGYENYISKQENTYKKQLEERDRILHQEQERFAAYRAEHEKELKMAREEMANAKSEAERITMENKVLKTESERLRDSLPARYAEYREHAKKRFGNIKTIEVFDFIATAELHHEIYTKNSHGDDLSYITIEYAKAVELTIYEVFERKIEKTIRPSTTMGGLLNEYVKPCCRQHPALKDAKNSRVVERLEKLTTLRNEAAHINVIRREEMKETRLLVMGTGKNAQNKDGLMDYLNHVLKV